MICAKIRNRISQIRHIISTYAKLEDDVCRLRNNLSEANKKIAQLEKEARRNLNNHEKYTDAIKKLNKILPYVNECITQTNEANKKIAQLEKEESRNLNNREKYTELIKNINKQMNKILPYINECRDQTNEVNKKIAQLEKEGSRNLNNHEKYTEAIKSINRQLNKIMPYISECMVQTEYEYLSTLPPELYPQELCDWYKKRMGKELRLDNPETFNEKLNWMKLYDSTATKADLADKVSVRKWISEKIGEQYLIPLLGVWESFDEIDFNSLPNQFVLKCNHGSGMNIIVEDIRSFDQSLARRKVIKWLNTNYAFTAGLELHYKEIKPLVFAEKYMGNEKEIIDYKFLCFHGIPKYIWVDYDRFSGHTRDIFSIDWELQPFTYRYPNAREHATRPANLAEMIQIAEKLSEGFDFVRVDLYCVDSRIYFGEMTFTSCNGVATFTPSEWDDTLGELI